MARLQGTLPLEFALMFQFFCVLFLLRYLKSSQKPCGRGKLSGLILGNDLLVFTMCVANKGRSVDHFGNNVGLRVAVRLLLDLQLELLIALVALVFLRLNNMESAKLALTAMLPWRFSPLPLSCWAFPLTWASQA